MITGKGFKFVLCLSTWFCFFLATPVNVLAAQDVFEQVPSEANLVIWTQDLGGVFEHAYQAFVKFDESVNDELNEAERDKEPLERIQEAIENGLVTGSAAWWVSYSDTKRGSWTSVVEVDGEKEEVESFATDLSELLGYKLYSFDAKPERDAGVPDIFVRNLFWQVKDNTLILSTDQEQKGFLDRSDEYAKRADDRVFEELAQRIGPSSKTSIRFFADDVAISKSIAIAETHRYPHTKIGTAITFLAAAAANAADLRAFGGQLKLGQDVRLSDFQTAISIDAFLLSVAPKKGIFRLIGDQGVSIPVETPHGFDPDLLLQIQVDGSEFSEAVKETLIHAASDDSFLSKELDANDPFDWLDKNNLNFADASDALASLNSLLFLEYWDNRLEGNYQPVGSMRAFHVGLLDDSLKAIQQMTAINYSWLANTEVESRFKTDEVEGGFNVFISDEAKQAYLQNEFQDWIKRHTEQRLRILERKTQREEERKPTDAERERLLADMKNNHIPKQREWFLSRYTTPFCIRDGWCYLNIMPATEDKFSMRPNVQLQQLKLLVEKIQQELHHGKAASIVFAAWLREPTVQRFFREQQLKKAIEAHKPVLVESSLAAFLHQESRIVMTAAAVERGFEIRVLIEKPSTPVKKLEENGIR